MTELNLFRLMTILPSLAMGIDSFAQQSLGADGPLVDVSLNIFVETESNLSGGIDTGTDYNSLADMEFALNGPVIGLPKGGRLQIGAAAIASGLPGQRLVGDFQGASDIEASSGYELYDLWYRQDFDTLPLQLRAGIIDFNAYFNITESALDLINSSFGIGAAVSANAPFSIYPKPGWGMMARFGTAGTGVLAGLFSGSPRDRSAPFSSGGLAIAEWQQEVSLDTRLHIGAWNCYCGTVQVETSGVYGSLELQVDGPSLKPFMLFLRGAGSRGAGIVVPHSFGMGIRFPGIISARPEDVFSAGITRAEFRSGTSETAHELMYLFQINRRMAIQADYQFIRHPSGSLPDAHVAMFRLRYSYDTGS